MKTIDVVASEISSAELVTVHGGAARGPAIKTWGQLGPGVRANLYKDGTLRLTVPKTADAKTVAYVSTLTGSDGAQLGKTAVVVMSAGSRAAFLSGQVASPDKTLDVRAQLDQLEGDLGTVLSRK